MRDVPDWLGRHWATWEVEAMVAVSMTVNGKQVMFTTPGTYHYTDEYYPGTIGTIVVQ